MTSPGKKTTSGHGWMYYVGGSAKLAGLVAAFKFVELLLVPPVADEPRWLVAGVLSFKLWGAGAALGMLWLIGRVSRRLFGWPAPESPSEPPSTTRPALKTAALRRRGWGGTVVLWWLVLGFLAVVMMADTGAGPIPRFVIGVFGPSDWVGLATVVLGLLVIAAPLVVLALRPRRRRPKRSPGGDVKR